MLPNYQTIILSPGVWDYENELDKGDQLFFVVYIVLSESLVQLYCGTQLPDGINAIQM
jgi:hypothetical protein